MSLETTGDEKTIRLTQYSRGGGCGCKISPKVLEEILHNSSNLPDNKNLLVGNSSNDDAAVYDLGDGKVVISSKDVEWICKNVFKQKYFELLEKYKMELTEIYSKKGYIYDEFFGRN